MVVRARWLRLCRNGPIGLWLCRRPDAHLVWWNYGRIGGYVEPGELECARVVGIEMKTHKCAPFCSVMGAIVEAGKRRVWEIYLSEKLIIEAR